MNYLDGTVNQRFAVLGKIRLLEDKSKYKNVAFIVTVGRDTSLFMIKPLNYIFLLYHNAIFLYNN